MDKLDQTRVELCEDFEELFYLYENYLNKLKEFKNDLEKAKKFIFPDNLIFVSKNLDRLTAAIKKYKDEMEYIYKSNLKIKEFRNKKYRYQDTLRTIASLTSNL